MELFHEVYGRYFLAVQKSIEGVQKGGISSSRDLYELIQRTAGGESGATILPHFQDGSWPMVQEKEGTFYSDFVVPIKRPMSSLEKSWLKALLSDRRIGLFLSPTEQKMLNDLLADEKPLFRWSDFYYFDQTKMGDAYDDPLYLEHFWKIRQALHENREIKMKYLSYKGRKSQIRLSPTKLEYSEKEDNFRLYGIIENQGNFSQGIYRLSRIKSLELLSAKGEKQDKNKTSFKSLPPIQIALSEERNTIERFMLQFASYEKKTVWNESRQKYVCSLFYNALDESEVLIQILSFGAMVEIIEPEFMQKKAAEKVKKQYQNLFGQIE